MSSLLTALQPCLGAISLMRHLDSASLSSPEDLQRRLCGFIDEMRNRLAAAGLSTQDVQDIAYAVVALADEVALNSGEVLAGYWMSNLLQFRYFHENTAGDGFFTRLQELRNSPRRKEALKAYTLCLLLGFQGRYRIRGGELELLTLIDSLPREAFGTDEELDALSPHGERTVEPLLKNRRNVPILIAGAAALVVALAIYTVERVYLSHSLTALREQIVALGGPPTP